MINAPVVGSACKRITLAIHAEEQEFTIRPESENVTPFVVAPGTLPPLPGGFMTNVRGSFGIPLLLASTSSSSPLTLNRLPANGDTIELRFIVVACFVIVVEPPILAVR